MTDVGSVVIHGHFYQPPREDPWLGVVTAEPSAAPFHDWNARIERECYGPVTTARVTGSDGRIERIVNTLAYASFDFGATLLRWLEREAPDTYAAVLEADRLSRVRTGGFGNAVAAPYHHSILPLCTRRDKVTEVRWGIRDFQRRFGREPEGMWLPETAVDDDTLDVIAQEGIAFTILAPHQVVEPPGDGAPGRLRTRSGREIAVFVYDGPLSHGVAFGELLRDAQVWADRILERLPPRGGAPLVSIATDGESYGHHHPFGEMALAAVVTDLSKRPGVRVENFASYLRRMPPVQDVEIVEDTSWSCAHGIERWRSNCGCKLDPAANTDQSWRAPLRGAIDWLVSTVHALFEERAGRLVPDPWRVRDAYAGILDGQDRGEFYSGLGLSGVRAVRLATLLEMERQALAAMTSCGWFFDDLAGIESVQVLEHAARAIELSGSRAPVLARGFRNLLAPARSNDPDQGNGTRIYDSHTRHPAPVEAMVAAGALWARSVTPEVDVSRQGDYSCRLEEDTAVVTHDRTGASRTFTGSVPARGRPSDTVVVTEECPGRERGRESPTTTPPALAGEGAATPKTWSVRVDQLPETARRPAADLARVRFIDAWLTPEERADLGVPGRGAPDGWERGLARAVLELAPLSPRDRRARAAELVMILESLGGPAPRPAQDALWKLAESADSYLREDLRNLARRLGFADLGGVP